MPNPCDPAPRRHADHPMLTGYSDAPSTLRHALDHVKSGRLPSRERRIHWFGLDGIAKRAMTTVRTLVLILAMLAGAVGFAVDSAKKSLSLDDVMTNSEQEKTGVAKLSAKERAALGEWLTGFAGIVATKVATEAAACFAKSGALRKRRSEALGQVQGRWRSVYSVGRWIALANFAARQNQYSVVAAYRECRYRREQ